MRSRSVLNGRHYHYTMYNYLEHTLGCEETQMSQSQLLSYLQEAVSLDRDLNQLRDDQMFRMSPGKTIMVLTQFMDALNDIAALADKTSPRAGGSGKTGGSGGRHQVNWTEFGCDSDDDDDTNENDDVIADTFNEDKVISYLVHKIAQKKQIGFISEEKWAKLSAECRKYLCDMSPDARAELCTSLANEMQGGGGNLEVNSAKTSGQDSDADKEDMTGTNAPTDGCAMVQEAIRDMTKKKKAAGLPRQQVLQRRTHTLVTTGR
jgi:hypothetical protein